MTAIEVGPRGFLGGVQGASNIVPLFYVPAPAPPPNPSPSWLDQGKKWDPHGVAELEFPEKASM